MFVYCWDIFPFLIVLVDAYQGELKKNRNLYLSLFVMSVLYLLFRNRISPLSDSTLSFFEFGRFVIRDWPTILMTYLRILFFPVDLHSHRRMVFQPILMFISPLVLMGLFFLFKRTLKKRDLLFVLGWILIGFLPKIPLLATNALMLDHWAYPSCMGICYWLAHQVKFLSERKGDVKWMGKALFFTLGLFWMGLSIWNIANRNTDKKLYLWALRYPSSFIVRGNLGITYYLEGDYPNAQKYLEESLAMNPDNLFAANALALTYWKLGMKDKAVSYLMPWKEKYPNNKQTLRNLELISGEK